MGHLTDALAAANMATALLQPGSEPWGEAQYAGATVLIALGRAVEGDARAQWALEASAGALSSASQASLLAARVRAIIDLGNPRAALVVADRALATAREARSKDATLRSTDARLAALIECGEYTHAVTAGEALVEAAEEQEHLDWAVRARAHLGRAQNHLGLFDEAHALLERSSPTPAPEVCVSMKPWASHTWE